MKDLSHEEREAFLRLCHAAHGAVLIGQLEDARVYFRQAIQIYPFSANVWFELARILEDDADKQVALENVLVLVPDHTEARHMLAIIAPDSLQAIDAAHWFE